MILNNGKGVDNMKILESKNNICIVENGDWTYLFSYNVPIAKVNNTIKNNIKENEYGLYFTINWDYSQTTLKHLYKFIEDYTTQRDENSNTFSYMLYNTNNKHEYLQKQINLENIKMVKENEF
jgi:5'-3' exonuclease